MDFSLWDIVIDLSLISTLLVIGVILRAKIIFLQKIFLPASIIAGILGLIFGPGVLGWIPFTDFIGQYPGVLIALVFGALPLSTAKFKIKEVLDKVGGLWAYSQLIMLTMYGVGFMLALFILVPAFDVHNGFGLLLAAGFVGGHGTAAAIGDAFSQQGWEEATSLAMTSATIGVILAIGVGLSLIKRATQTGHANYLTDFKDLPAELRTGLLPRDKRETMGNETVSSISLDPLAFHLVLVIIVTGVGYYLSTLGEQLHESLAIPAFSLSFLAGLILKKIMDALKVDHYIDRNVMGKISGTATDVLIAFGIASINLTAVAQNIVPFIILMVFGIVFAYLSYRYLSQFFFQDNWFEKGIFTFGWITGAVAMGISLLKIADPKFNSRVLEDFGLAYIPIAPVEVTIITFAPMLVVMGLTGNIIIIAATFIGTAIILGITYSRGWHKMEQGKNN